LSEASEIRRTVQQEFERTARSFAARTRNRFDALDVPGFARLQVGETVLEVGAGTGNFLAKFEGAGRRLGVDLTWAMLEQARATHPGLLLIQGDGASLPLKTKSVDIASCAQMLHHVWEPVPLIKEMRRVMSDYGRLLIVDQAATEKYEESLAMTRLETIRDPSHAVSRPPSAYRTIVQAAHLQVIDEKVVEVRERFSEWTSPEEFPPDRLRRLEEFIETNGRDTGMMFERTDGEWWFTRRRIMLLATKAV
jgi:ubiquinone/menaquinone biosynthesis C-methylase UbiE